jgi:sensor histidine kinase YesM
MVDRFVIVLGSRTVQGRLVVHCIIRAKQNPALEFTLSSPLRTSGAELPGTLFSMATDKFGTTWYINSKFTPLIPSSSYALSQIALTILNSAITAYFSSKFCHYNQIFPDYFQSKSYCIKMQFIFLIRAFLMQFWTLSSSDVFSFLFE